MNKDKLNIIMLEGKLLILGGIKLCISVPFPFLVPLPLARCVDVIVKLDGVFVTPSLGCPDFASL